MVGGVLLHILWVCCVTMSIEVVEGVQRLHRPLQLGWYLCKREEDSGNSLLDLLHPCRIDEVIIHADSDGGWPLLLR